MKSNKLSQLLLGAAVAGLLGGVVGTNYAYSSDGEETTEQEEPTEQTAEDSGQEHGGEENDAKNGGDDHNCGNGCE